jgi:hypothetical protein
MTQRNGIGAIADIADEPDLELFDVEAFGMPDSFEDQSLAPVAYEHLQAIYRARFNAAANQVVNPTEAQRWTQVETQSRVALAKIKREHPRALEMARQIAIQQDLAAKASGGR